MREEVEAQINTSGDVKDWCRIAAALPGRNNKDCRKRWHNSVAGGLKKGQWSKSEDALLARAVEQHGQRWTLVANCVESRSADQCAKRWQQSLDPELDHSEWRDDEDRLLIEATQQLGRHWKDIQREYFPGRSKNTIKNRYTVLVRRYQNNGIALPSRPSSPSEMSTSAPPSQYYPEDEDYYDIPGSYNSLMPPQPQHSSAGSRRSWSSIDSDGAVSAWSNAPSYDLSLGVPTTSMSHTTHSMPGYAFAPPPAQPSHSWPWPSTTTSSMDPSYSMQVRSPVSYHTPAQPHYDDFPMAQPLMSPSSGRAYSRSPGRASYPGLQANAVPTSTPRAQTWSEQQSYDSLAQTTYPDARHQQNPLYRY